MKRRVPKRKNLFGFGQSKALSARQTTPARGGIAAHARGQREEKQQYRKTAHIAGSYGGYKIFKTEDGEFYSTLDPDSMFSTKKQVQAFVDWWQKGHANPSRRNVADAFWFITKSRKGLGLERVSDAVELKGVRLEGPFETKGEALARLKRYNPSDFERCVTAVTKRGGAYDPRAVCAAAGRKKYGQREMTRRSIIGKKKARRGNPAEAAVEAFEEFHGHEPDEVVEVVKKVHFHEHLAGAGTLKRLVVLGIDGRNHLINGFRGALLAFNERKNQLFIEGGDQAVNLEDYGIETPHELETLGKVKHIDYETRKDHLGDEGGQAVYTHQFRTTNERGQHVIVTIARYPDLIYRVRDEQLEFSGGSYEIRAEGIDK